MTSQSSVDEDDQKLDTARRELVSKIAPSLSSLSIRGAGYAPVFEQQLDALAEEAERDLALDALVQTCDTLPRNRLPEDIELRLVERTAGR